MFPLSGEADSALGELAFGAYAAELLAELLA